MKGLAGQIALAAIAVAVVVGLVLTVGTLTFSSRSFAELMVEHGETLAAAQAMFQESVARFFVAALAVAALAGIGLALFVGRRVAAPLREVSAAARLIARGDHAVRVQPRGPEEVRSLADSFNRMAHEIHEQERMRREFVSNAAHELRTPLTNLQGYLEALRDGVMMADRTTYESLHEEVDRMVRLSRSLDALAEGDLAERATENTGDVDVRAAIAAALDLYAAAAERRGLRVELNVPAPIVARADSDHLAQIIANLLQNAVQYTPEGGRITVAARRRDTDVLVTVSNTGPGIPADDLPHVFERFYRVEKSRDRATGGAGIGLAIVKTLVERAGGRVGAESAPGATRFWFSLPAAAVATYAASASMSRPTAAPSE
ncbi:MAG: HAMP domain-containing histidine kinase [Chloroflexi bacterium]|nr:MAG: HAMP domain-containing histidine kinase [Chloroflexota bacterium]